MSKRRAELEGVEKAVSNALDDWLFRFHQIITSWTEPDVFIDLLREEGYEIREIR